jgi:hypothetical protein
VRQCNVFHAASTFHHKLSRGLQEKAKTATTQFQTTLNSSTKDILKEINEFLGEHAQKEIVNAIEANMNQVVTELQTTFGSSTKDIKAHLNNFVGNTQKFAVDIQNKLDEASKNAEKDIKFSRIRSRRQ